ncbi:MAG: flagellar biosynthetic protein FliR [Parachlamydiaceae bacterium]|nr:flagellar biosynthetic protein FliR [Parachlamydiaceae bacterium]
MTDSYVTLFLNSAFAQGDLRAALSLFFLFLARMLPIIAMSPFFGSRVLPNPTKVFFAITLFVIFLPKLLLSVSTAIDFNPRLVLLVCKELFVGLTIGFIISIPFIIVQASGMIIDHQRGGASLMVNDPTIQNQSSPLGTIFNMVLIYIFYSIDGPFYFIDAIFQSYEVIPPDQFLNPKFFGDNSPFWRMQIKLFNEVMVTATRLAGPALIAILMTDVFLGIANRLAPQVQITFLGMPLKSLLGLTVIWAGWYLLTGEFTRQAYHWLRVVTNMIQMYRVSSEVVQ